MRFESDKTTYHFSTEKNFLLINERGISFEEVIMEIENGNILDVLPHPNAKKYPHQSVYVVNIRNYVYMAPFVRQDKNNVFLKTIFPHRKLTKQYLGGN